MEDYCCVFGCNTNSKTHPHLGFFSFPTDDERSEKWLKVIDREDINNDKKNKTAFRVCQLHFESSYILGSSELDNNAVPTLNLPNTITSSRCFKPEPTELIIKEEPFDEPESETAADGRLQLTVCKQRNTRNNILIAEKYSKLSTSPSEIISIQADPTFKGVSSKNLTCTHWSCSTQTVAIAKKTKKCQTASRFYDETTCIYAIPPKVKLTPEKLKGFFEFCDIVLTEKLAKLVKIQARLKYESNGERCTKAYKSFCNNMCERNPLVYAQFRNFLHLPCLTNEEEHGVQIEENDPDCSYIQEIITEPFDFKTMEEHSAINQDSIASCSHSNQQNDTRSQKRSSADAFEQNDDDDNENKNSSRKVKIKSIPHDPYFDNILNVILAHQNRFLKSLDK